MESQETHAPFSEEISEKSHLLNQVITEVQKVVVGQETMVQRLLIGLLTGGHILLEGVPGLAKTLTVNTLAQALNLDFKRIQFTPDLLPADLVGTMIYNQQKSVFEVKKGPIFANLILADEVNRAPAKVQAALLEAMAEKQVTIGDATYALEQPFLVMATQNPVDQEGTYPLPEAQVDRFMLKVEVGYPSKNDELTIMRRMTNQDDAISISRILQKNDVLSLRKMVQQVSLAPSLEQYIVDLVFASRDPLSYGLSKEASYIRFGVSPRASINMHRAAKALAFLNGRDYVLPEDIKEVALDVMAHRLLLEYEAEADGVKQRDIVTSILNKVTIQKS